MESHPLTTATATLIQDKGAPIVLDVEHSIQVHRPTLTGARSPATYYIQPPAGMTAEELIAWFEAVPEWASFNLTLVPINGIDTYHQPIISSDDFAKKNFHDNRQRIVRVVGKTDQALEAMAAFIEALKRPFVPGEFPHLQDFLVSGYQPPETGRATEVKLLYKPGDANQLMKLERDVIVHLDERSLGREIRTARHSTRSQPPELILIATGSTPAGLRYLADLAQSRPRATADDIARAVELSERTVNSTGLEERAKTRAAFATVAAPTVSPVEQRKRAVASLVEVMKGTRFADGAEIKIAQGGTALEVVFPRTLATLFLSTSFNETKHIRAIAKACVGVRADPNTRDGWAAIYQFDSKSGKLTVRAADPNAEPPTDWKRIPFLD